MKDVILINNVKYYKVQYETTFTYKPIPDEFKPYFESLYEENGKLKQALNDTERTAFEIKYELEKENKQLKKALEYINDELPYLYRNNRNCKRLGEIMQLENVLALLEDEGDDKE